jgi:hypothetical protein
MADNVGITPGSGAKAASREVTYSGEAAQVQVVGLATFSGSDDAKVVRDVTDDDPYPVKDEGARGLLLRILQMLMAPLGFDKSLSRQRVTGIIESGTVTTVSTVTTVTTLSTLSNVAAIGGYSAQMQVMDTNRTAWAQSVRARIT